MTLPKLSPQTRSWLVSLAGSVCALVGAAVVAKLAELPALAPYAPAILAIGTALLGKEHLTSEKAKP